jgi:hypothetical protein
VLDKNTAQIRIDGIEPSIDTVNNRYIINLTGAKGIAGSVNLSVTDKFGTPITSGY